MRNVHITDVHGTFYHFGVCFMRAYNTEFRGLFENITIDNFYASKSDRALVKFPVVFNYRRYGLIDIESLIDVKNLKISDVHRREFVDAEAPTINIFENSTVDNLILDNITTENHVDDRTIPVIVNHAEVKNRRAESIY